MKKIDYIIIAATSVVLVFVTRAMPSWISSWMLLQWNITYETGFIRRGLVGSITNAVFNPFYSSHLYAIGIINIVLYLIAMNFFLMWLYKKYKTTSMFIFIVFFISSPFVTQWYFTAAMFQRLDVILNILFIASLILIIKSKNKMIKTYVGLGVITLLSMLIHDGYAVYSVPTVLGILLLSRYHKNENRKMWQPFAFYLAPMVALYFLIMLLGQPKLPIEAYHELLCTKSVEVAFQLTNVKSLFYMSVGERIRYAIEMMSGHKLFNIIGTILLMTPSIAVVACMWKAAFQSSKSKLQTLLIYLLLAASFSTVAAFFLAIDIMRWLGYIAFNNLFSLAALMLLDKSYADAMAAMAEKIKYLMIFAIVFAVILGPTQWMDGFEIINKIAPFFGLS